MRIHRSLATAALFAGFSSVATGQSVHLNEIYPSHTGDDLQEYIELVGTPGMSLDNLCVLVVESQGGGQGTLDRVWDLTGSTVPADGYFLMANDFSGFPFDYSLDQGPHTLSSFYVQGQNNVENGSETFYIIEAANALAIDDLENVYYNGTIDADLDLITLLDTDPNYTILEVVAMVDPDWPTLDNVYDCAPAIGPDGTFFPAGIYRNGDYPNGWCTDNFLIFGNPNDPFNTPGAPNPTAACTTVQSSTGCMGGNTIGSNYCDPANPNTTGLAGVITATGSDVATANDLTLTGSQLPPSEFAYFIGGQTQGLVMNPGGSQGNLCIIGTIARFNTQIGQIDAGGEFSIMVDTANIPLSPVVAIQAGETWNFQCWHRDFISGQGPTSNFTNGVSILFQ